MDSLLTINYSNMSRLSSTDSLIENEFISLYKQYQSIKCCIVSVASLDYLPKSGSCYQVGINLQMQSDQSFFVVRNPSYASQTEFIELVVTDAFNTLKRQLDDVLKVA